MREIKFRIWDADDKSMWEIHNLGFFAAQGIDSIEDIEKKNCVILWFTGLKDKNGKEIYEGDIVRIFTMGGGEWRDEGHVEAIEWYKAGFSRVWGEGNFPLWWLDEDTQKFEVIGNIYENPELLSQCP